MRTQLAVLALSCTVGAVGAGLLAPGLASADVPGTAGASSPTTLIRDALSGLVTDDTITQAQADRVATVLAERLPARGGRGDHGGRHGGARLSPEATATAAGVTVEELRAGREAGRTLAQIAAARGVAKQTLIDRLVAAQKAALAAAVQAGTLTQAQADARSTDLVARTTAKVDQVGRPHGHRD